MHHKHISSFDQGIQLGGIWRCIGSLVLNGCLHLGKLVTVTASPLQYIDLRLRAVQIGGSFFQRVGGHICVPYHNNLLNLCFVDHHVKPLPSRRCR